MFHYELINKVLASFSRPFLFEELPSQGGRLSEFMLVRALTPPLVTPVLHIMIVAPPLRGSALINQS